MFKKIFFSITLIITLITGYLFYFSFGEPLLFMDSFKWAVSSHHTRAKAIDSIAYLKFEDISKLRAIYPDLGDPLDKQGFLLIVEGKYEFSGGYSDGKTPMVTQKHTGTLYYIRGATGKMLTFSIPQKPDYERLSSAGSLRKIHLPFIPSRINSYLNGITPP